MHREVIDPLLTLLDERIPVDVPGEILRPSPHLFERLINRNGANWDRRISDDPFAGLVDVLAGGEIHHRVRAPQRRPLQLFDFVLDGRSHGGVPDIRVDLHQEVPADDHRLELQVTNIGGNDRAPASHFVPHELRGQSFSRRDDLHFGRDGTVTRIVKLRADDFGPPARVDPRLAQLGQTAAHVAAARATRVVQANGRLPVAERHFAHGNLQDRRWTISRQPNRPGVVHFPRAWVSGFEINHESSGRDLRGIAASLRRFQPDQVPRVCLNPGRPSTSMSHLSTSKAGIPLAAADDYTREMRSLIVVGLLLSGYVVAAQTPPAPKPATPPPPTSKPAQPAQPQPAQPAPK